MSRLMQFDRSRLASAFTEIEEISQKLPEGALVELAQEVGKRVALNLSPKLPAEIRPTPAQIDSLCNALLSRDPDEAVTMIETAQRKGASHETLWLAYLGDASRRLGEWWVEDRVSFYQVTLGAGRIYAILRILRLQSPPPAPHAGWSALFANVPGDDHTLGITIAADMARDRGWDIDLLVGHAHDEMVAEIERRNPPIIGLSAGSRKTLPALLKLILALRLTNPHAKILVCGHIATLELELGDVAGVDGTALDFDEAIAFMDRVAKTSAKRARA